MTTTAPGSKDPSRAASRYANELNSCVEALETQRKRILTFAANAPRLLKGTPEECVNLTGEPRIELESYVITLGRTRAAAESMLVVFHDPAEVAAALVALDVAVPHLRRAYDAILWVDGPGRLDHFIWLTALYEATDDGRAVPLVDPRENHHDAALRFCSALLTYCRTYYRAE